MRNGIIKRDKLAPNKIVTIHNGTNVNRFHPERLPKIPIKSHLNIPNDASIITTIAQAIPEKGINHLLKSMKLLLKQGYRVNLIHVGDGPYLEKLRKMAIELQVAEYVTFTGFIQNDLVDSILLETDIFTLCTNFGEAFSLVPLEAMAMAKPVVATRVGGTPEAIEDGVTGLLIPPKNPDALTKVIIKLLKNKELARKMGEAGRKRAEEHFDINTMVNKTIQIYENCMKQ